jgi:hypothetical protein
MPDPHRDHHVKRSELKRIVWDLRWRELLTVEQVRGRLFEMGHGKVVEGVFRPWTKAVVYKWWREAEADAKAEFAERAGVLRAVAVSAHLRLHNEALDAWERSKKGAALRREKTVKVQETVPASGNKPARTRLVDGRSEAVNELRDQAGDPRYLAEARANMQAAIAVTQGDVRPADLPETTEEDAETANLVLNVLAERQRSKNGRG